MLLLIVMVYLVIHHLTTHTYKEVGYTAFIVLHSNLSTEIAIPPEPVDPLTVDIQSMYDYRRGYFGHARLNITWENPASMVPLAKLVPA